MQAMGFTKPTGLRVVRLTMSETGSYNPQYQRPYETRMDGDVARALTDKVMQSPGNRITSSMLGGLSSSFIAPSARPEGEVSIVNGWNERRVRFILELEIQFGLGTTLNQYVQGYTSFNGVTNQGAVAPEMEFFINSIITTRKTVRVTPLGTQELENVIENNHVLADNNWANMYSATQQRLMRPQDVFTNITSSHVPGSFGNPSGADMGLGGVYDSRTVLRKDATMSSRANGLPSAYAARLMDGYAASVGLMDFGENELKLLEHSRGQVKEAPAAQDPFLAALTSIRREIVNNRFRFADLCQLDHNTPHVTNYTVRGPAQLAGVHTTGMTSGWHGQDRLTQVATIISQSLPAMMMELMVQQVHFRSSNHDHQGFITTQVLDGKSFSNMDLRMNFELLKRRIEDELIRDITYGNSVSYAMEVRANLLGDMWISLEIDSSGRYDYVVPSFCDNLLTPVLTGSIETVTNLAHDFESLNETMKDAMGNRIDSLTTSVPSQYQV